MEMSHVYTIAMVNQTIVADATLCIVHTASSAGTRGSMLEILRATVSQHDTETQQQLGVLVGQKASAFGTYTSTTPNPHVIGGTASGITGGTSGAAGTAGTDASAEGAGTVTTLHQEGFDNRAGWLWVPTPDERPLLLPDNAFIVKIVGTPATLTAWDATLTYREVN